MKARCPRCYLHHELCVCALIPRLETKTQVVILMHAQEEGKPSNTGRLAHLCLPNSEIRLRGSSDRTPLNLDGLTSPERENWMLGMGPDATELTPALVASLQKPVRLLVPDGTWSQASRLASKLQKSLPIKRIRLVADRPSEYRLRTEHDENGMATFEAIARTLGVLEGSHIRSEMEKVFQIMTDRWLWARGKLARHEVRGGIPPEVKS